MKNRTKLAFSAALMLGTIPLLASSCQEFGPFHFDITTMGIVPGTAVESPENTFRLPAGPAKRTLRINLESRVTFNGRTTPTQPEFCTLDLGGRMDIAFVLSDGATFVGEVQTPTSYGAGKSASGVLNCQLAGQPVSDSFKVVIVK